MRRTRSVTKMLEEKEQSEQINQEPEMHKGIRVQRFPHKPTTIHTLADATRKLDEVHDPRNRSSLRVEGRTLPVGHQWNGADLPGRGKAAARRLRQMQKGQVKP